MSHMPRDPRSYLPFFKRYYFEAGGIGYHVARAIVGVLIFLLIGVLAAALMKWITGPTATPGAHQQLHLTGHVTPPGGSDVPWHVQHYDASDLGHHAWATTWMANPRQANKMIHAAVYHYKKRHPKRAPYSVAYYMRKLHHRTNCIGRGTYDWDYRLSVRVCNGHVVYSKPTKSEVQKVGSIIICGAGVFLALASIPETAGASTFVSTFIYGSTSCGWAAWASFDS